jgi:hypothetical protein
MINKAQVNLEPKIEIEEYKKEQTSDWPAKVLT